MTRTKLLALTAAAAALMPDLAHAGVDRTIRGRIYFHNGRIQYSTGTGSRLTSTHSHGDDTAALPHVQYRVFAKCGSTTKTSSLKTAGDNGYFEAKFTNICSAPKFRIQVFFRSKPGSQVYHQVQTPTGVVHDAIVPHAGWMSTESSSFQSGRLWRSLSVSCTAEWKWQCPNPDNDNAHRAANIYKSGIDVFERWGYYKHGDYGRFKIEYPHPEGNSAAGISTIKASSDVWDDNHRVAHELGHAYQKRALDLNDSLSASEWCSGHSWHHVPDASNASGYQLSETCATSEGWADFFAAATYFNSNASRPYYRFCGDDCDNGTTAECSCTDANLSTACQRQCRIDGDGNGTLARQLVDGATWNRGWKPKKSGSNPVMYSCVRHPSAGNSSVKPHATEGNVARFFWDVYDNRSDGSADGIAYAPSVLLDAWDSLPKTGFGDGKVREPKNSSNNWDDRNGRNVRDFIEAGGFSSTARSRLEALLGVNCLGAQTSN